MLRKQNNLQQELLSAVEFCCLFLLNQTQLTGYTFVSLFPFLREALERSQAAVRI